MANKNEDRQGMLFIGCIVLSSGVGLAVSTITDNWIYMAACTTAGVGLGFILMSLINKK